MLRDSSRRGRSCRGGGGGTMVFRTKTPGTESKLRLREHAHVPGSYTTKLALSRSSARAEGAQLPSSESNPNGIFAEIRARSSSYPRTSALFRFYFSAGPRLGTFLASRSLGR